LEGPRGFKRVIGGFAVVHGRVVREQVNEDDCVGGVFYARFNAAIEEVLKSSMSLGGSSGRAS
jgi:hypothetical protein